MRRIEILEDRGYFIGSVAQTELHKHHALEVIVSKEHLINVRTASGAVINTKLALIRPDELHQTTTQGEAAFIFIEPESELARRLIVQFAVNEPVQNISEEVSPVELMSLSEGQVPASWLKPSLIFEPIDDRIKRVVEFIQANITSHDLSQDVIADIACLSSSRVLHLFKEQVGIPLRAFVLWCRMKAGVQAVLSGMNLTEAAHEAGFSDASHLSRTFMDMFGVNPSLVLRK